MCQVKGRAAAVLTAVAEPRADDSPGAQPLREAARWHPTCTQRTLGGGPHARDTCRAGEHGKSHNPRANPLLRMLLAPGQASENRSWSDPLPLLLLLLLRLGLTCWTLAAPEAGATPSASALCLSELRLEPIQLEPRAAAGASSSARGCCCCRQLTAVLPQAPLPWHRLLAHILCCASLMPPAVVEETPTPPQICTESRRSDSWSSPGCAVRPGADKTVASPEARTDSKVSQGACRADSKGFARSAPC